jgi:hypothetical protein
MTKVRSALKTRACDGVSTTPDYREERRRPAPKDEATARRAVYIFVKTCTNPAADRYVKVVAVALYVSPVVGFDAEGHTGVVVTALPLKTTVSEAVLTMVPPSPFDSLMMNCKQPPAILAVAAAGGTGGVEASPQL